MLFNITISKCDVVEVFDSAKLPAASTTFALDYGLRQWINDGHAQVVRKDYPTGDAGEVAYRADAKKGAMARVEKLRTGQGLPGITAVSPVLVAAAKAGLTEAQLLALIATAVKAPKGDKGATA